MTISSICILALDDYPFLTGDRSGHVGGEMIQHVLLARAWRDLGLEVSMIVQDHGQGRERLVDGIRTVAVYKHSAGIPGVRFLHPRLTSKLEAMREIDADVYYQSPAGADAGVVAWFCRRHGKQSLIRIASDLGCIPGRQHIRFWRDRKLYDHGLRSADLIAAQTTHQVELLRRHYGVDSHVVNMAVEPEAAGPATPKDIDVLWVGNLRPVKRPELVFELARRLPNISFTLVGGSLPREEAYFERIVAKAGRLPNLRIAGAVPYDEVGPVFSRARVFLNTSSAEGFPNSFLQAWTRGVPVVTFFDPDGLVRRHGLGCAVATVDEMAEALRLIVGDEVRRRSLGEKARAFVRTDYSADVVARHYLELLGATQKNARTQRSAASRDRSWGR